MKNLSSSFIFIASIVIGLGFIGLLVANQNQKVIDNITLPLTITEYFDYQCTHCADFHPAIAEVKQKYGDDVVVEYKPYPFLSELSYTLAYGAEAAREQNKHIEYHDAVFEKVKQVFDGVGNSADVTPEFFAEELNLDMDKFTSDYNNAEIRARVDASKSEGASLGVNSTPTVFIAGQVIDELGMINTVTGEVDYSLFINKVADLIELAKSK